jgi:hypothetical protein
MLKLDLPVEPFWADLPHGVRVRIKPGKLISSIWDKDTKNLY